MINSVCETLWRTFYLMRKRNSKKKKISGHLKKWYWVRAKWHCLEGSCSTDLRRHLVSSTEVRPLTQRSPGAPSAPPWSGRAKERVCGWSSDWLAALFPALASSSWSTCPAATACALWLLALQPCLSSMESSGSDLCFCDFGTVDLALSKAATTEQALPPALFLGIWRP